MKLNIHKTFIQNFIHFSQAHLAVCDWSIKTGKPLAGTNKQKKKAILEGKSFCHWVLVISIFVSLGCIHFALCLIKLFCHCKAQKWGKTIFSFQVHGITVSSLELSISPQLATMLVLPLLQHDPGTGQRHRGETPTLLLGDGPLFLSWWMLWYGPFAHCQKSCPSYSFLKIR